MAIVDNTGKKYIHMNRKVFITSDAGISRVCDKVPANEGRQSLVSSLISAYELDTTTIPIVRANRRELEGYHDPLFVKALLRKRKRETDTGLEGEKCSQNSGSEDDRLEKDQLEHDLESDDDSVYSDDLDDILDDSKFGLQDDCYPFLKMEEYVKCVGGSSISAAKLLVRRTAEQQGRNAIEQDIEQLIAINWYGGRHHCHKRSAAGFCYVNDICLAIGTLRKKFQKVFYLDLDLHHGDGVENAYKMSLNVATCLIHRYDIGFYPGSGSLESSGKYKYTYNIPTQKGLSDCTLGEIIERIVEPLILLFDSQVVVIQTGCDGLSTDPHKEWNLTIKGIASAVKRIVDTVYPIPVLLLGGGGYNHTETAKCWAYVTKVLTGDNKDWDMLPEHSYLDSYEDDGYQFWTNNNTEAKRIKDRNAGEYIEELVSWYKKMGIEK